MMNVSEVNLCCLILTNINTKITNSQIREELYARSKFSFIMLQIYICSTLFLWEDIYKINKQQYRPITQDHI